MANKRIRQICKAIHMMVSPTDILVMVRNNATGLLNTYVIPESYYDTFRREYGDDIVELVTGGRQMQKLTDQSLEGRREYVVEPFFSVWAPERACLFCKKCRDLIWDYTNGPYMFFCDEDVDGEKKLTERGAIGKCEFFEECYEEVEKQNQDLKRQEVEIKEFREKMKTDPEYKKMQEDFVKAMTDYVLHGNLYGISPELLTACPKPFEPKRRDNNERSCCTR